MVACNCQLRWWHVGTDEMVMVTCSYTVFAATVRVQAIEWQAAAMQGECHNKMFLLLGCLQWVGISSHESGCVMWDGSNLRHCKMLPLLLVCSP